MLLTSIILSSPLIFYFLPTIFYFIHISHISLSAMNDSDNIVSTVSHATVSNNVVGVGRGGIGNW